MRILIFHSYLLHGTGSNIYNANLVRALAALGHDVHLFCQDRTAQKLDGVTIHTPNIGNISPVYVADRYEGFDALPFPQLDDAALKHYLDANVAAIRAAPSPDIALANHLVMGPVILARGLAGRAPYAVKVHGSALESPFDRTRNAFCLTRWRGFAARRVYWWARVTRPKVCGRCCLMRLHCPSGRVWGRREWI